MVSSAKTSNLTVWVAWAFSQQGCILVLPMCRPATGVEKCCAHDLWDAWKSVNWVGSMLLTLREWYFSILFLGVVATYLCTWSCPLHSFFQQWQAQWDSLAECSVWGDTQTVSSSRTSPKSFEIRSGPHMLHSHANTRKGYHGLPWVTCTATNSRGPGISTAKSGDRPRHFGPAASWELRDIRLTAHR